MLKTNVLIPAICSILIISASCNHIAQASDLRMSEVEKNIEKQAETLRELGLSDISDEAIHLTQKASAPIDPITLLIENAASGDFDYDDVWTPSSSQIYCFDVQVNDIENMYSLFFQGITSINDNEFEISNVVEDMRNVDAGSGEGPRTVNFLYNGQEQLFIANDYYDWFDMKIIDFMNDLFEEKGNEKKLYFFCVEYEVCIVFYRTEAWAKEFEAKTGRELRSSTNET